MLRERRAQRVVKRIPGCLSRETLGVALRCAGEGDDGVARGGQERREGHAEKKRGTGEDRDVERWWVFQVRSMWRAALVVP